MSVSGKPVEPFNIDEKEHKKSISWLAFGVSLIVHLLFWIPTVYIVVLCIQRNYTLTVLHAALLTVGCGLLMTEAVLVVSGEAVLATKVSRRNRIKLHWLLNVLGLALIIAGFVVMVVSKNQSGSAHFVTDHAIVGLTGVIASLAVGLTGIPILRSELLPKILGLVYVKLFHICLGISAVILVLATQILGIHKRWWSGTELTRELCFAAYVVGAFFLLIKPLHSWGTRVYGLL